MRKKLLNHKKTSFLFIIIIIIITIRETALLYKDGVSAASNRERIAIVISHELAHQWFGKII